MQDPKRNSPEWRMAEEVARESIDWESPIYRNEDEAIEEYRFLREDIYEDECERRWYRFNRDR